MRQGRLLGSACSFTARGSRRQRQSLVEGALAGGSLLLSGRNQHHQPFSKIRVSILTSFILYFKRKVEKSVRELNVSGQEMNLSRSYSPFSPFFEIVFAHKRVVRSAVRLHSLRNLRLRWCCSSQSH